MRAGSRDSAFPYVLLVATSVHFSSAHPSPPQPVAQWQLPNPNPPNVRRMGSTENIPRGTDFYQISDDFVGIRSIIMRTNGRIVLLFNAVIDYKGEI